MNRDELSKYTLDILNPIRNHFNRKFERTNITSLFGFNPGYIIIRIHKCPLLSEYTKFEDRLIYAKYIMEIVQKYSGGKMIEVRFIDRDILFEDNYKPYIVLYTQDFKFGDIAIDLSTKEQIEVIVSDFFNVFQSGKYISKKWADMYKGFIKKDFLIN